MPYIHGMSVLFGQRETKAFLHDCGLADIAATLPAPSEESGLRALLPGANLRRISPIGRLALHSACLALGQAESGLPLPDAVGEKTGLYIGTAFGDMGATFSYIGGIMRDGAQLASPTMFSHSISNVFCGLVGMALNIQGPGSTVCQFGLSFAGALQTAITDLALAGIEYALVGAVEQACPDLPPIYEQAVRQGSAVPAARPPQEDCAVFFLLGPDLPDRPDRRPVSISIHWGEPAGPVPGAEQESCRPETSSGRHGNCLYSGHPSRQALDTALYAAMLRHGHLPSKRAACRYQEPFWHAEATIILEQSE